MSSLALPAVAHAHCGCTDSAGVSLVPAAGAATQPGAISLGLTGTVTEYERVVGKGTQAHGDEYDLRSYHTQLVLGFQATDRLRLQVNVPHVVRETGGTGAPPADDGLGDVAVLGAWRLAGSESARLDLLAGVETPTGDTDGLRGSHGSHGAAAQDMTLGSGSWDVLLGAAGHAATGPLTWIGEVVWHLNREGDHDYAFGDELTWRAGPFVALGPAARLGVQASGVHRDRDERAGAEVDVSGSDWILVGPALHVQAAGGWFGALTVDIPVERDVNKQQMAPEWRGRLSVAKGF